MFAVLLFLEAQVACCCEYKDQRFHFQCKIGHRFHLCTCPLNINPDCNVNKHAFAILKNESPESDASFMVVLSFPADGRIDNSAALAPLGIGVAEGSVR